jgi:succinyl-CoA synthetase alpha subunit
VVTAEGIPDLDILQVVHYAARKGARVLGPDTPGLISPGKCKLGVHPHVLFKEGRVGILSRSGSLSYEVGRVLTANGIGQSTVVGIGFSDVKKATKFPKPMLITIIANWIIAPH